MNIQKQKVQCKPDEPSSLNWRGRIHNWEIKEEAKALQKNKANELEGSGSP